MVSKFPKEIAHHSVSETLLNDDLQVENIRGQGYDGAAGQYSGLQSRITAENDKSIYVHCRS